MIDASDVATILANTNNLLAFPHRGMPFQKGKCPENEKGVSNFETPFFSE